MTSESSHDNYAAAGGLEVRPIDYVPLGERHGKVWHLGPLWFMSNAQIATLAVGLISVSGAGSPGWRAARKRPSAALVVSGPGQPPASRTLITGCGVSREGEV